MAEYAYTWVASYTTNNGGLTWDLFGSPVVRTGTLSDGQGAGPGTFDATDSIDDDAGISNLGYYGTTDLLSDGDTYVVLQVNATSIQIFGNPTDPSMVTPPGGIADASIPADAYTTCFAIGTMIRAPHGETAVEDLEIGSEILTANGGQTRVRWVGRQTVHKRFTPRERFEPVRVSAGALGDGLPVRDLVLTADHALVIDGLLVQACALVNGTTMRRVNSNELAERVTYYHVETEGHEVILAEGTPAETFVDNVSRRLFDNFSEYAALYGEDAEVIPEMSAPRVMSARQLPETLRKRFGSAMTG